MPDPGLVASKVKAYMEALSPSARSMLMRAMRAAETSGEQALPAEILRALSDGLDILESAPVQRVPAVPPRSWREQIEEVFFAPVMPLCMDVPCAVKQAGRIDRASIPKIWTWLVRDLANKEFEQVLNAAPQEADADPAPMARKFRRDATELMLQKVRTSEIDTKAWQRLTAQLGGDAVVADLRDVLYVFQRDAAIANFLGQLPRAVSAADLTETSGLVALLRGVIDQSLIEASYVGAYLLPRVTSPNYLILLAARMAASTDPRAIHGSLYGHLVEVALSEADRLAATATACVSERNERAKVLPILREFHDLVRQVSLAIELDKVKPWHKRLGGARRAMSELIAKEIDNAPGLLRRALRVESLAGGFGGGFDADTMDDAEFAVRLLMEARLASDSLALNEVIARTRKGVEQTLEVVGSRLFADLKSNASFDRRALLEAVDGAIRLNAVVFGADYAAVLKKSRDLAVAKPPARSA